MGDDYPFTRFKGSEFASAARIQALLNRLPDSQKKEFHQLLKLMCSPLMGLIWPGPFKSFEKLTPDEREELLTSWAKSKKITFRRAFLTLKKLSLFLAYSLDENTHDHPAFASLGYSFKHDFQGGDRENVEFPKDTFLNPTHDLAAQVLVIGSGAGGGVIAYELAKAGLDVLVVEKGDYYDASRMSGKEGEMAAALYEQGAAMASKDGSLTVLAGSTLGGGTTVNWAGAFHTPDYIREEWAKKHSNPFFTSQHFTDCLDAVAAMMEVSTDYDEHNPQNAALFKASLEVEDKVHRIPRNDVNPKGDQRRFGFSCLGDRYGDKRGSTEAFLKKAAQLGAKILCRAEVQKLIIEKRRVKGAEVIYTNKEGKQEQLQISAERVFVCAGAMHSPALLVRSGLVHKHIGMHLHVHPTVAVAGLYNEPMEPWFGPMMSTVNDSYVQLDGNYGFKLETPPVHPAQLAMSISWDSGHGHKIRMLDAASYGNFIVLSRDKHPGRIAVDAKGRPIVKYTIHPYDFEHLKKGMIVSAKFHFQAGARKVFFPHNILTATDDPEQVDQVIASRDWLPASYMLFTAHQMGTCRMGGDERKHVVKPNGESYEVKNLYVADASCFPSASGANPMLTIMGIAHHIARELLG
jgi:choline dehydrogenase-like flavoprotein